MTDCGKVLLIEYDEKLHFSLQSILSHLFHVISVRKYDQIIKSVRVELPDIILAHLEISAKENILLLEEIRQHASTRHIAVIVISSSENEEARILAYQKGVDDLMCLPFTSRELEARVLVKLRRVREAKGQRSALTCGSLVLDLEKLEACDGEKFISLSVLEFNLLRYFVENKNRVLSRREILEAVWVDSVVSDRTVDTHIACLRRKLSSADYVLTTIYGAGYTLKVKQEVLNPSFGDPLSPAV